MTNEVISLAIYSYAYFGDISLRNRSRFMIRIRVIVTKSVPYRCNYDMQRLHLNFIM